MTHQDTMRLALEALKQAKDAVSEWGSYASEYFQQKHDLQGDLDAIQSAITAMRSALAQQGEQQPMVTKTEKGCVLHVGWDDLPAGTKLYAGAAPAAQPLSDEQISDLWDGHTVPVFGKTGINPIVFARAIEAAHGIGV